MAGSGRKSSVPQDVITDILSKLPVKSLIRFKAVSKTWRRLVQTPDFIAAHLRFSTSNPALLASRSNSDGKHFSMSLIDSVSTTTKVDHLYIPFLVDRHQYASVVGTINGLVCVSSSSLDNLLLLWNPATKAYRQFPRSLINAQCNTGSKITVGFGHDCAADDYKLVRIVYEGSYLNSARVEVLSWRTGSWRVIEDVDLPYKASDLTALTTVNGELFWYAEEDDDDEGFLFSFNLHDEVFRKVPKPGAVYDDYEQGVVHNIKFDVWKESLVFFVFFEMTGGVRNKLFDLWVMDDGVADKPWRRALRLELKLGPEFQLLEPYIIWSDSEIILKSRTEIMYFYNINTNKLKLNRINIHRFVKTYYELDIHTFKYVPSLVSVYGGGEE